MLVWCDDEVQSKSPVWPNSSPLLSGPYSKKLLGRSSHCSVDGGGGVPNGPHGALLGDCLGKAATCSTTEQTSEEQKTAGGCCLRKFVHLWAERQQ